MWSRVGYVKDHPNPAPNDSSWRCTVCSSNPCQGFCFKCLQTCHPVHRTECPYITGEKTVKVWDYTRPCIKCRTPRAKHQPWNCPSNARVRMLTRQHPPRILVDYDYRPPPKRVSHVNNAWWEDDEEWEDDGEWEDENEFSRSAVTALASRTESNTERTGKKKYIHVYKAACTAVHSHMHAHVWCHIMHMMA